MIAIKALKAILHSGPDSSLRACLFSTSGKDRARTSCLRALSFLSTFQKKGLSMATAVKIKCLPEPELQFSNGRRDLDPRRALATNGPADHRGVRAIRVGLVGLADEVNAARAWI